MYIYLPLQQATVYQKIIVPVGTASNNLTCIVYPRVPLGSTGRSVAFFHCENAAYQGRSEGRETALQVFWRDSWFGATCDERGVVFVAVVMVVWAVNIEFEGWWVLDVECVFTQKHHIIISSCKHAKCVVRCLTRLRLLYRTTRVGGVWVIFCITRETCWKAPYNVCFVVADLMKTTIQRIRLFARLSDLPGSTVHDTLFV